MFDYTTSCIQKYSNYKGMDNMKCMKTLLMFQQIYIWYKLYCLECCVMIIQLQYFLKENYNTNLYT
jgi:hypothetical protein